MKKFLLIACSIGALLSCNREEILVQELPDNVTEVNEAAQGTIPVHLSIGKKNIYTKGTTPNEKESALANVRLTIQAWGSSSISPSYTQTYDLGDASEIIVNMSACEYAYFIVESGEVKDGEFQKTLEGQKEYLYATGKIRVTWDEMQQQDSPFEVTISRNINKISIEKISINWSNDNYDSREFRIKKVYLSDVPRTYIENCNGVTVKGYNSDFTGTKEDVKIYNNGGLDGYTLRCVSDNKYYSTNVFRLDDQLVDEVDAVVTKNSPYVAPHTFYSYISNSGKSIYISTASPEGNYVNLYIPVTTIVIEAELDGEKMYYKVPVVENLDKAPANTHITFKELRITGLGSSTLHGTKAFENISFKFEDWVVDNRSEATENL